MSATTTIALSIAAALDDDGTTYETASGRTLDELSREAGATTIRRNDFDGWLRYEYPDGSAIVDCGSAWDLAHDPAPGSECWCWAGDFSEHSEDCTLNPDRLAREADEAAEWGD